MLSIIGALAEIVVEERERIRRWAEDHPRVRELRELEARGRAELEARRKATEAAEADR